MKPASINNSKEIKINRIVIPGKYKEDIRKELEVFGISKRSLFPELADQAEFIKEKYRKKKIMAPEPSSQKEVHWRRSLRLVLGIWLFALTLFLLQSILPDSAGREPVQVVLFLVLILLALPSALLLLTDELRGRLRGRAGILAAYLLFIATGAGIGALIGSLLLRPAPLLPLKPVIFIHLLLALGLLVCTLGAPLAKLPRPFR